MKKSIWLATIWLAMLVLAASIGCESLMKSGVSPPEPTRCIGQVPQTIPIDAKLVGEGKTAVPFYFYITPEAKANLEAGRTDINYFLMTASYGKDGKISNESHGPIPGEQIIQVVQLCLEYAFRAIASEGEAAWLLYVDIYFEATKT